MARDNSRKREIAVALQYAEGDSVPRVVASGAGEIAKRILEIAKQHHIPLREDTTLAEILSKVAVGSDIPPETYRIVAEILAFLYRTDAEWRKRKEGQYTAMRKR